MLRKQPVNTAQASSHPTATDLGWKVCIQKMDKPFKALKDRKTADKKTHITTLTEACNNAETYISTHNQYINTTAIARRKILLKYQTALATALRSVERDRIALLALQEKINSNNEVIREHEAKSAALTKTTLSQALHTPQTEPKKSSAARPSSKRISRDSSKTKESWRQESHSSSVNPADSPYPAQTVSSDSITRLTIETPESKTEMPSDNSSHDYQSLPDTPTGTLPATLTIPSPTHSSSTAIDERSPGTSSEAPLESDSKATVTSPHHLEKGSGIDSPSSIPNLSSGTSSDTSPDATLGVEGATSSSTTHHTQDFSPGMGTPSVTIVINPEIAPPSTVVSTLSSTQSHPITTTPGINPSTLFHTPPTLSVRSPLLPKRTKDKAADKQEKEPNCCMRYFCCCFLSKKTPTEAVDNTKTTPGVPPALQKM